MEILHRQTLQLDDKEIVSRILEGEKELYEILLRRYNQTLFRAIRSYINEQVDVEDAMQNTYLRAYEKLNQYRGESAFHTWLIRIGINEALKHLRSRKKRQNLFSVNDEDHTSNIIQLSDQKMMNPEMKVIQGETRRLIEKAIDQLPEKYRTVYMLREVEGIPNSEIADCLDISESNVKVRLHRAKTLLKETLYNLSLTTEVFEFGNTHCDLLVARVMQLI
ncbi:MAG: RNA polymerase sigma factor [Saprospiraceae bacterium]|nr:MAG: RNA polymerase sigma factor [Saprospiraceae bacterium]